MACLLVAPDDGQFGSSHGSLPLESALRDWIKVAWWSVGWVDNSICITSAETRL